MNTQETSLQPFVSDRTCLNSYGAGWRALLPCFLMLLLASAVGGILEHLFDGSSQADDGSGGAGLFGLLYSVFLGWPIGMSVSWVFLKAVRREEVRFLDIFAVFKRNYWNAVSAGALHALILIAGFILLIIPGIYFACRLAFVGYLIMDRRMGAVEALQESWAMTRGNTLTIFCMGLLMIPIYIAGFLAMIVGVFVSAMWVSAAFAVLYHSVCVQRGLVGSCPPPAPEGRGVLAGS